MNDLLRRAYAECAIRSRRLGRVEVPGRVPGDNFNAASLVSPNERRKRVSLAEDIRLQIIAQLKIRPMLADELASALGVERHVLKNAIAVLRERGHVRFKRETTTTPKGGLNLNRYSLTDEGRAFNGEAPKSAAQRVDAVLRVMTAPEEVAPVAPVSAPRGVTLAPWPKQEAAE